MKTQDIYWNRAAETMSRDELAAAQLKGLRFSVEQAWKSEFSRGLLKKGGLSGPAVLPIAVRMVWEVRQAVSVPILGMGGVRSGEVSARLKFSNTYNARQDVAGELRLGELSAAVSNLTQAVLVFPLAEPFE